MTRLTKYLVLHYTFAEFTSDLEFCYAALYIYYKMSGRSAGNMFMSEQNGGY